MSDCCLNAAIPSTEKMIRRCSSGQMLHKHPKTCVSQTILLRNGPAYRPESPLSQGPETHSTTQDIKMMKLVVAKLQRYPTESAEPKRGSRGVRIPLLVVSPPKNISPRTNWRCRLRSSNRQNSSWNTRHAEPFAFLFPFWIKQALAGELCGPSCANPGLPLWLFMSFEKQCVLLVG